MTRYLCLLLAVLAITLSGCGAAAPNHDDPGAQPPAADPGLSEDTIPGT